MVKFSPKDPAETYPLTFDFNEYLNGEAISSVAVSVTVYSGIDPSPGDLLYGSASIVGDKVIQVARNGLAGVEYLVRVTATTPTVMKHTLGRVLPVKLAGTW